MNKMRRSKPRCWISPRIGLLPIAGESARTAEKTSLLAISPGGIDNLLIDKEN
jgi:hypothetical protein